MMSEVENLVNAVMDVIDPYLGPGSARLRHRKDIHADAIRQAVTKILTPPSLEDYGLQRGEQVRYIAHGKARARPARVTGINRDGSVLLATDSGATRSILPESLQREKAGPRGGKSWVPVTTPNERTP